MFEGAADSSYDCGIWLLCPLFRTATDSLPTGHKARESPSTLVRKGALQVDRGKQAGWSCLKRVPQAWHGTAWPAVSPPATSNLPSSGALLPSPLLPVPAHCPLQINWHWSPGWCFALRPSPDLYLLLRKKWRRKRRNLWN